MKKWHMECIVSFEGRNTPKLEIPHPGRQSLWSPAASVRRRPESFLFKALRAAKERVLRQM